METPQQKKIREELAQKLVRDLHTMRDALTRLSLTLHDMQYELEEPRRQAAAQLASDCIARCQSRQH